MELRTGLRLSRGFLRSVSGGDAGYRVGVPFCYERVRVFSFDGAKQRGTAFELPEVSAVRPPHRILEVGIMFGNNMIWYDMMKKTG